MFEQFTFIIAKTIVVLVAIVVVSVEITFRAASLIVCILLYVVCAIFAPVLENLDNFDVVEDFIKWGLNPKLTWTPAAIKAYKKALGC